MYCYSVKSRGGSSRVSLETPKKVISDPYDLNHSPYVPGREEGIEILHALVYSSTPSFNMATPIQEFQN